MSKLLDTINSPVDLKKIVGRLIDNSIKSLEMFGDRAEVLKDISEYIIARKF